MTDLICSVPDCRRPHNCRGYCRAHYGRLMRWGDVRADVPLRDLPTAVERGDIEGRILRKTVRTAEGCLEWTGRKAPGGYGVMSINGSERVVHRIMWELKIAPIPTDDDWTIDHLCRNRACVNTEHLEVVTRVENSLRGGGLAVAQAKNRTRAHCPNGHRYTPETTYRSADGHRMCKICKNAAWHKGKSLVNDERRRRYRAHRAAGATAYQAIHAEWWKYPAERPA